MKNKGKVMVAFVVAVILIVIATAIGSASLGLEQVFQILGNQILGIKLPEDISANTVSILWKIRFPRVLMAFFVGGCFGC